MFAICSPPITWTALWHPCTEKDSPTAACPAEMLLLVLVLVPIPWSPDQPWCLQEAGSSIKADARRRSTLTPVKSSQDIKVQMYVAKWWCFFISPMLFWGCSTHPSSYLFYHQLTEASVLPEKPYAKFRRKAMTSTGAEFTTTHNGSSLANVLS